VRPLIGVSTYREQARWGVWESTAALLPATYPDAVHAAGGEPVLLPTGATSEDVVSRLDALVVAGGADVDPALYGAAPDPALGALRRDRDSSESLLLRAALARGIPVLAICRGLQLLNVTLGGTLVQHLPDRVGTEVHDPGPALFVRRTVRVATGSGLHGIVGDTAEAACHHHQAIDRLADGLTATAWAEDGTIEAVETRDGPFCLGVQWHPEEGTDLRLFQALVGSCPV
jgi:gamma-glutamyl-gamma-aminobutyrate hydrolase PuuD